MNPAWETSEGSLTEVEFQMQKRSRWKMQLAQSP